jgi:hypothetical protein
MGCTLCWADRHTAVADQHPIFSTIPLHPTHAATAAKSFVAKRGITGRTATQQNKQFQYMTYLPPTPPIQIGGCYEKRAQVTAS